VKCTFVVKENILLICQTHPNNQWDWKS